MSIDELRTALTGELDSLRTQGLLKDERLIASPQDAHVRLHDGRELLNLCSNNYLGLADHPDVVAAAHAALDRWGFGMASVRFICGTQEIHRELEQRISEFLGTEDTILYGSCFDANGGLFETLLDSEDTVISDELNHASIIDGIRLCRARRLRYSNRDIADLERCLREAEGSRRTLVVTDGVFSMDGYLAPVDEICELADRYGALVMVDDSHAVGFMGARGRGTHEHCGVMGRVDIFTGTLGKALGGASGGYTSGRREIIELLRQRSRPYLFSNTLAPVVAATTIKVLEMLEASTGLHDKLHGNAAYFRSKMIEAGFNIPAGDHPIVPIMLGDARLATAMADRLLEKGIYVIGFYFPVVPKGQARIRVQISAAHTRENLDYAIQQFINVKQELG